MKGSKMAGTPEYIEATMIAVAVKKDGGENGTASKPASYTYTVTHVDGREFGKEVPVQMNRPACSTKPGTHGMVYWRNRKLFLMWVDETPNITVCE